MNDHEKQAIVVIFGLALMLLGICYLPNDDVPAVWIIAFALFAYFCSFFPSEQ